ncbi:hypothetical protein NGRA_3191, partial [Nosema granulosis]
MEIGELKVYVLVGIDYYTRFLYGKIISEKSSKNIIQVLEEWFVNEVVPEEIISDNAKEFESTEYKEWCSVNEIRQHKVSIESHRSNGRIERAIRTIRESVFKQGGKFTEEMVVNAVRGYNQTFHSAIKCTPEEAKEDAEVNEELRLENSQEGVYAENFVKLARETFIKGQRVRIAKRENLGTVGKRDSGRFIRKGIIVEVCEKDSYLVRTDEGRIVKK